MAEIFSLLLNLKASTQSQCRALYGLLPPSFTNHNFLILSYPNAKQGPYLLRLQLSPKVSELPFFRASASPCFCRRPARKDKTLASGLVPGTVLIYSLGYAVGIANPFLASINCYFLHRLF